ncbi:putative Zn-dependent peptidase [Balneicella halophila]|uniref:Putative Zn-dependent peptidase n=1 Tax=Balneicella halophila TaxID=1537566 RepID=A0A7L4UPL9_BALHA|nr:pitrilysin family protein [Balneicella halophila]PVX51058.1 putative Zn-dependent peptidase [Balneicella halophila]
MKRIITLVASIVALGTVLSAQEIKFEEYDLDNGMHVILHQDNTAPVVTVGVMYHVGAKDENPERTGFAHFFEHLLFEGTKNIGRGEFMKIVSKNGGSNNANTSSDRTYYYETFPSNNQKLGLWLESERLRHPVINQIGVDTQNEVVKEEKRMRMDNQPYGNISTALLQSMFKKHPYKGTVIGSMEHLDAAQLSEFQDFFKKYYIPNNASLVVAGDIDPAETKEWIQQYFADIPAGEPIVRDFPQEDPITEETEVTWNDANIQIPAYLLTYRTPSNKVKDAYVLNMLSTYLSDGKSSVLYKKLVDQDKKALQVGAFNMGMEDQSIFAILALPMGDTSKETLINDIDAEIKKVQEELISEKDFQKLQNIAESNFVQSNSSIQGIAASLVTYNVLYGDTNLINNEIDIYRNITREDIKRVANQYLKPSQRVVINYLPEQKK